MARRKVSHGHNIKTGPGKPRNHCFACGKDNPDGMKLKFYLNEESRRAVCEFKTALFLDKARVVGNKDETTIPSNSPVPFAAQACSAHGRFLKAGLGNLLERAFGKMRRP